MREEKKTTGEGNAPRLAYIDPISPNEYKVMFSGVKPSKTFTDYWTAHTAKQRWENPTPEDLRIEALERAVNQIANLWPRNTTAEIEDVNGINDGNSRAILLATAVQIARDVLEVTPKAPSGAIGREEELFRQKVGLDLEGPNS